MERNAKHVACRLKGRSVIITDRDLKAPLYFDNYNEAHAACALLNLGFPWCNTYGNRTVETAVQSLILTPAPKER